MRRVTFWLSLVLIFTIPWEDSITTAALGSVARVVGLVVAACWLSTLLLEGRFRKPHLFHVLVLLFFLWNVITTFWTLDLESTYQRLKTYGQIFLLMLILWELYQKPADLVAGLQAYVLGAFVNVASTVINYIRGTTAVAWEGRYSATGINAVDLALILILGLPVALQLVFEASKEGRSSILKFLYISYFPLAFFAIILTGSRTSLFAIIPLGLYILLTQQINFDRKILGFFIIAVAGLALVPFIPQSVVARLGTAAMSIEAGDLGGRVNLWWQAIAVFSGHPLLGVGSGAIDCILGSAVHNTYLSIAAETGLIGFILFFSILTVVFFEGLNSSYENSGLGLTIFMTWAIGVCSLSWEFRKFTWLFLSFVVIEASLIHEQVRSKTVEAALSESRGSALDLNVLEPKTKAVE